MYLSANQRKYLKECIENPMTIAARNKDAFKKAWGVERSAARNDTDPARILLGQRQSACLFWRYYIFWCEDTCIAHEAFRQRHRRLDCYLWLVAGDTLDSVVVESMRNEGESLADDEPCMILAWAYHLRARMEPYKQYRQTLAGMAYGYAQLVKSVEVAGPTGESLNSIKAHFNSLVAINTNTEMVELVVDDIDNDDIDFDMVDLGLEEIEQEHEFVRKALA